MKKLKIYTRLEHARVCCDGRNGDRSKSDGIPDREAICMTRDLFRLMFFEPKVAPAFLHWAATT